LHEGSAEHFRQRFDEKIVAPHHAFVDAQASPLVITPVLEDALPAWGLIGKKLRREERRQDSARIFDITLTSDFVVGDGGKL
jgi:hypothetical protein